MCSEHPKKWLPQLGLARWWYKTNYHAALKCTPFQALFGFLPPHLNFHQVENTRVLAANVFLRERCNTLSLLRDQLVKAQARMKNYADQHRIERSFVIGDSVYLKLQHYKQSSLARRSSFKLAPRFYGPFQVREKIDTGLTSQNCQLQLRFIMFFMCPCLNNILEHRSKQFLHFHQWLQIEG